MNPSDESFARNLLNAKMVDAPRLDAAKSRQFELEQQGLKRSIAEILVEQGVITPTVRNALELMQLSGREQGVQSLGRFKFVRKLGEGGMGSVYLADDAENGRQVALKVLPEKFSTDPELLSRFRREARTAASLHHPNIVAAYETGEERGAHYYAMEYCAGEPLDQLVARTGPLTWQRALELTIQIALGLQYAHEHGIVHRDIKPGNIFIATDGTAKILDMGLSKNLSDQQASFNTQSGAVLGTPHYISPEQVRGDKVVDGRSDIYSLGAMLYNLVTGATPFSGATPALTMLKHLNEQLPDPRTIKAELPLNVVEIIRKMMAKDAEDRYRDCNELITDLTLALAGHTPASKPVDQSKSNVSRVSTRLKASVPSPNAASEVTVIRNPSAISAPAKKPPMIWIGAGVAAIVLIVVLLTILRGGPAQLSANVPAGDLNSSVVNAAVNPYANDPAVLAFENFEHLDIAKLPANMKLQGAALASMESDKDHGKVLSLKAGNPPAMLTIQFDPDKAQGRAVKVSLLAKGSAPLAPNAAYTSFVTADGTRFGQAATLESVEGGWSKLRVVRPVQPGARVFIVELKGPESGSGATLFDDIKIEFVPISEAPGHSSVSAPNQPENQEPAKSSAKFPFFK